LTILWELGRYLYLSLSPPRVIFFHIHSHLTNQASLSSIDAPNHLCPKLSDSLRWLAPRERGKGREDQDPLICGRQKISIIGPLWLGRWRSLVVKQWPGIYA
jgi:hypothetical protein